MISDSSAFSKHSLNIWEFMVHLLLNPGLKNFELCFATMWDGCRCAPQQKKPPQWEIHTPLLEDSPYSLKLEKRCRWNAHKAIRLRMCHQLTDGLPEIVLPLPPRRLWLMCGFTGREEACLCMESGGVPLRPPWAAGLWKGMSSVFPGTNLHPWFRATSEFTALREPAIVNVASGTEMVHGWAWSVGVWTTLGEYPSPLPSTPESLFKKKNLFICLHRVLISSLPSEPPGMPFLLGQRSLFFAVVCELLVVAREI